MDVAVIRQFVDFFQDFFTLYQSDAWPNNNTSENEIKNAFLMSQHLEKCLQRLQKKQMLNDFLCSISNDEIALSSMKSCLKDPMKCLLHKVITSKTKINQMDLAFKIYFNIFGEDRLEKCLADLMLEAASIQTLLVNMPQLLDKENILHFKSSLFLLEFQSCDNQRETFLSLFDDCNQETVELIVTSSINNDIQYQQSIINMIKLLVDVTKRKLNSHKRFWKLLLNVNEKYLIEMCLRHNDWYKVVCKALIDCGKLLQENLSAEYFYIDLSYSELVRHIRTLCLDDSLKEEFLDFVTETDSNIDFWKNILL